MSRKSEAVRTAKFQALKAHLVSAGGKPSPQSLSHSYGLTPAEVQRVIEEINP